MKKTLAFVLIIFLCLASPAQAFTVYDPINAALNQIRNALMQAQHLEDIRLLLDQIRHLKNTYDEMLRFNFGIDEILSLAVGDLSGMGGFLNDITDTRIFNLGYEMKAPVHALISIVEGASSANPRAAYEAVFGKDPLSPVRPDLTYEDVRIVNALRLSAEIMKESKKTKETGRKISEASQSASPKGAARLSADALGKLLQVSAGTNEDLGRLIELQANELSRTAMEEKHAETARLKFIKDFDEIVKRLEDRRWES